MVTCNRVPSNRSQQCKMLQKDKTKQKKTVLQMLIPRCQWSLARSESLVSFSFSSMGMGVRKTVQIPMVLLSWGSVTRHHKLGVLKMTEMYSLTVPEAGSLKSRCHLPGHAPSWLLGLDNHPSHSVSLLCNLIITWWSPLCLFCPSFLYRDQSYQIKGTLYFGMRLCL